MTLVQLMRGAVGAALVVAACPAATNTWDGGGATNQWTVSTNYVGDTPLADGDVLVFDAQSTARLTNGLGASWSLAGLVLSNAPGNVLITNVVSGSVTQRLAVGSAGINLSQATTNLTLPTRLEITATQTWTVAPGRTLSVARSAADGRMSGAGDITVAGGGTVDLYSDTNGLSGFAGNWLVTGHSRLRLQQAAGNPADTAHLGQGGVTLSNGALSTIPSSFPAFGNPVHLADGTTNVLDEHSTLAGRGMRLVGPLTGGGVLLVSNTGNASGLTGCLTLAGTNTFSGPLTIASNAFLRVGGTNSVGPSSSDYSPGLNGTLGSGPVTILGTLLFNRRNAYDYGLPLTNHGVIVQGQGGGGGTQTLSGAISGTGLVRVVSGTLVLTATNTYAGGTWLATNSRLYLAQAAAGGAGRVTVSNGAALVLGYAADAAVTNLVTAGSSGVLALGADTAAPLNFGFFTNGFGLGAAAGMTSIVSGGLLPDASGTLRLGGGGGTLVVNSVLSGATPLFITPNGTATGAVVLAASNNLTGPVTIGAGQFLQFGTNGPVTTSTGGVITNLGTLVFRPGGTLVHTNAITGTGTVLHAGAGITELTAAHTYDGRTRVSNGTLRVTGKLYATNVSGANNAEWVIVSGSNATLEVNDVRHDIADPLVTGLGGLRENTYALVLTNGGRLLATLPAAATNVSTRGLTVRTGGGVLESATAGTLLRFTNQSATSSVFSVLATLRVGGAGDLRLEKPVTGAGGLDKFGAGTLWLGAPDARNTYSGGLSVRGGTVRLTSPTALGSNYSIGTGFTVYGPAVRDGVLDLNGQATYDPGPSGNPSLPSGGGMMLSSPLELGGVTNGVMLVTNSGTGGLVLIDTLAVSYTNAGHPGTATLAAPVVGSGTRFSTSREFRILDSTGTAVEVDVTGGIGTGPGYTDGRSTALLKTGAGTLRLSSSNGWPRLQIDAGRVVLNHPFGLGTGRSPDTGLVHSVTVAGVLDLNGHSPAIGELSSGFTTNTGVVRNDGAVPSVLTVGLSAGDVAAFGFFEGVIQDGASSVGLVKLGDSSLSLYGSNTYSGATVVSNGGFTFIGQLPNTPVTMHPGTYLSASGLVQSVVIHSNVEVFVEGDSGVADLTCSGSATFRDGAIVYWDAESGDVHDRITASSLVFETGTITLRLGDYGLGYPVMGSNYVLFTATSGVITGFNPANVIIDEWGTGWANLVVFVDGSNIVLQATAPPPGGFESWQIAYFGATTNAGAAWDEDPDGDGLNNLLEYAFNNDPAYALSADQPLVATNGGFLSISVPRNSDATDITYWVEESPDLLAWSAVTSFTAVDPAPPGTLLFISGTNAVVPGGRGYLRVRVTLP